MKSNTQNSLARRDILKGSIFGLLGLSFPGIAYSNVSNDSMAKSKKPYPSYPSLEPELVSEVVGKSHFDLERVKELVEERPELARASWEWRFGDFESAIGAASHVGRRDIVEYLLSKGASPNIFTYTVLGAFDIVKQMIDLSPGIQKTLGPHGISLLDHAYAGFRMKDSLSASQTDKCKMLIDYLEELGDANGPE